MEIGKVEEKRGKKRNKRIHTDLNSIGNRNKDWETSSTPSR